MRRMKFLVLVLLSATSAYADKATVWIGMDRPNNGQREGIYRTTLDLESGALERPVLAVAVGEPEFLTLHPNGKVLYAACKLDKGAAAVAAYKIANGGQSLTLLNDVSTGGGQA